MSVGHIPAPCYPDTNSVSLLQNIPAPDTPPALPRSMASQLTPATRKKSGQKDQNKNGQGSALNRKTHYFLATNTAILPRKDPQKTHQAGIRPKSGTLHQGPKKNRQGSTLHQEIEKPSRCAKPASTLRVPYMRLGSDSSFLKRNLHPGETGTETELP